MYASAFFVLCIAIMLNITTQIPFVGFLPVVRWIDVAVNAVVAALCIFLFIKPGCKIISYLLFFIEGGVTVHMGFVGIGTLLFTAGCVFVFVNGDFKRRYKEKIAALILYWALITVLLYFAFNIKMMIFEIALTLFHFGLLACLYKSWNRSCPFFCPQPKSFFLKLSFPLRDQTYACWTTAFLSVKSFLLKVWSTEEKPTKSLPPNTM